MKIEAKKLQQFLKYVGMKGTQSMDDILLKFEEQGLVAGGMSLSNTCMTRGLLNKTTFKDYKEFGVLAIEGLQTFLNVIDRFDGEIELGVEGNLLTISKGTKSVGVELASEQFIKNKIAEPKLEFAGSFMITVDTLQNIFKDVLTNKEAEVIIRASEGKVRFENTGKYKFSTEVDAPDVKGDVYVKYGEPLLDALSNIKSGDLKVFVQTNYPLEVVYDDEDMKINIIVGPRVEDQ